MRIVYIDLLFLTNLIPDYLLLRLTACLLGRYTRGFRIWLGSIFAALCAIPLYFLPMSMYMALAAKAAVCLLVCLMTFGRQKLTAVCTLFTAMSFAFAGAVSALCWLGVTEGASVRGGTVYANLSLPMLILASLLAYCVMRLIFTRGEGAKGGRKAKIEVQLQGRQAVFDAYEDSGNDLREPFTGRGVIVVSMPACLPLLPPESAEALSGQEDASHLFEILSKNHPRTFGLIPYSTASGGGLMLTVKPDRVTVNGKTDNRIIGISPREITASGCCALIGV